MGLLLNLEQLAKMTIAVQSSCPLCISHCPHHETNDTLCMLFRMQGMDVSCHIRLQAHYCQNLHLMLLTVGTSVSVICQYCHDVSVIAGR